MKATKEISLRVDFGDWHAVDSTTLTFEQIANMREGALEESIVKDMFDRLYRTFLHYRGKA